MLLVVLNKVYSRAQLWLNEHGTNTRQTPQHALNPWVPVIDELELLHRNMCHHKGSSVCETSVKTLALVNVCHPQTVGAPANEDTVNFSYREIHIILCKNWHYPNQWSLKHFVTINCISVIRWVHTRFQMIVLCIIFWLANMNMLRVSC